jgi:hypothetical protein
MELGNPGETREARRFILVRASGEKPYVQFGGGIMWRAICPRGGSRRRRGDDTLKGRPRPPYIGLQVDFHLF